MTPTSPRRTDAETLRAAFPRLSYLLGAHVFEALVADATSATAPGDLDPGASLCRLLAEHDVASLGIPPRLAGDLAAVEWASHEVARLASVQPDDRLHRDELQSACDEGQDDLLLRPVLALAIVPVAFRLERWRTPPEPGPPAPGPCRGEIPPRSPCNLLVHVAPGVRAAGAWPAWRALSPTEGRALSLVTMGLSLGEVSRRAEQGQWLSARALADLLVEWTDEGLFAGVLRSSGRRPRALSPLGPASPAPR